MKYRNYIKKMIELNINLIYY